MNTITIKFSRAENAKQREEKIREEMMPLLPFDTIEAKLSKEGYPDIDYGFGNDDLVFADSITITYEQLPAQRCKTCGCHELMACMHDKLGPCWWVKDDLCSHCQLESIGKLTDVQRPWQKKQSTIKSENV